MTLNHILSYYLFATLGICVCDIYIHMLYDGMSDMLITSQALPFPQQCTEERAKIVFSDMFSLEIVQSLCLCTNTSSLCNSQWDVIFCWFFSPLELTLDMPLVFFKVSQIMFGNLNMKKHYFRILIYCVDCIAFSLLGGWKH